MLCYSFTPSTPKAMDGKAGSQGEGRPVEGVWPTAVLCLGEHRPTCFTEVHGAETAHAKRETDPPPAFDCTPTAPRARRSWGGPGCSFRPTEERQGPRQASWDTARPASAARRHSEPGARQAIAAQKAPGRLEAAFNAGAAIFPSRASPPPQHPSPPGALPQALPRPTAPRHERPPPSRPLTAGGRALSVRGGGEAWPRVPAPAGWGGGVACAGRCRSWSGRASLPLPAREV